MKDNKILGKDGGGSSSSEVEKSRFDQVVEEVKTSIFSVFYLLLKNQETTFWKFLILLIVEYFQLLSFSFDKSVKSIQHTYLLIVGERVESRRCGLLFHAVPSNIPSGLLASTNDLGSLHNHFLYLSVLSLPRDLELLIRSDFIQA